MVFTEYLYITFWVDMVHNDKRKSVYLAICIICKTAILFSNTAISKNEGHYCFFQKSQLQYTTDPKIDMPLPNMPKYFPLLYIFFYFIFFV